MEYRFHETALLYVGMPFAISIALIMVRSPSVTVSWKKHYFNRLIDAFIIMFGSSVVLFEGFVCVAMFIPLYTIIIFLTFLVDFARRRARENNRSTLNISILPFLLVLSSLEGITPNFSFGRDTQVSVSRVINAGSADIKRNLCEPIDLQKSRPWFLQLFPMPYEIKAGTLSPGDIHEIHFRYYRWFVTNMHEGRMLLEISNVEETRIKTTFVKDTSYISHYLRLKGTEIALEKVDEHRTRVTLRIDFQRKLDPYWYFSPIERFGVTKMAELLMTEVIIRDTH